jgi:hexokinase
LSRSYQHGPALIGAIFGTGTNGAYIDKTRTITKLGKKRIESAESAGDHAGKFMVVNTEWGALDNGVSGGASLLKSRELMRSRGLACRYRYSTISWIERA